MPLGQLFWSAATGRWSRPRVRWWTSPAFDSDERPP